MRGRDIQIAVVFNLEDGTSRGEPQDLIALQYTACTAQSLYEAIERLGYPAVKIAVKNSLEEFIDELSHFSNRDTFIFNNCDGFKGENYGSVCVTQAIEDLGFKHTGSTADVIASCTDKARAKNRLIEADVSTPPYQVFYEPKGTFPLPLQFPLIVKPVSEDASVGIDLKSVVCNTTDLFDRISYLKEQYAQPALVEEFVRGRELTVSLWGNQMVETLPVTEEDFSLITDPLACLLTYESKWIENSFSYQNILVRCPAALPPEMEESVLKTAVQCYKAMGLRDFARVDLRYHDRPYVIDINEIPDLSPDAGFARAARSAGLTYDEMVERILDLALKREGWR